VGNQAKTCATGPLYAKANSCWRYVGNAASPASAPDDYGYLNTADFPNKTLTDPVYRQISADMYHTCALKVDNTLACWGSKYDKQDVKRVLDARVWKHCNCCLGAFTRPNPLKAAPS